MLLHFWNLEKTLSSLKHKGSETLLKFSKQHFFANLPLISNKFSCLSCVLVGCETPGPFFKVLTADHIYSCHNREKFAQQVQTQLSSKPLTFSGNFIAILKSTENSEHFGKKINSIPSIFPKLWFLKNVVIWMPESFCFRTPSGNQRVKGSKTLMKFHGGTFVLMFHSDQTNWVAHHLLVVSKMLGPFFNTLTGDHMYSCHNWHKFPQQVQTQLSSKR